MKEFFKRKPGKIVILVLSILLSQITAMLFLKAFANLESWFGMYLNDSASIYCGCVLLIQVFLTSFFLDKGFSVSVLITLAEVGICLFIGISEIYWDTWSTTTNGIICFALVILLVLLFSWDENGDRYTKVLISFLTTLYAVGILNIALVWIDDIWRVLIRAAVAVILLAVSCQLIISAMGKKAFRGLSLLSAFACVFQTWLWLYIMKESIFQQFPDGLIPAGWKTRWCLTVQGILVLGFGLTAIVFGIRSVRTEEKERVSGREAGKICNALPCNSVKRFASVVTAVVMLFAAVFSVLCIADKDRRWKHLDGLLSAGKLEGAVEWMDLHPGDILNQKEYQEWVLTCMGFEKVWEYDCGNSALIPREGITHEVKSLMIFFPHVTISNNIAHMLLEDEENNVIFELSDHNDGRGFANEWGSLIYETSRYDHKSPRDETNYYLTYEDDNLLIFLQYDMDRVLMDYCIYKAAGAEADPACSPEQRDLEIRQRWGFNPFYERVYLIGG